MRERIIMCLLVLFAAISLHADTWYGESDTGWYNADLREFQIMNAAQFKGLADLVNNENVTFEECEVYLMSDIDLNGIQWHPIGYGNTNFGGSEFKGKFIGNNHSINGMLINCIELPYATGTGIGLFGNSSGELSGLNLSGTMYVNNDYYYSSSVYNIGGICGDSKGNVHNCACDINMNLEATNSFMSIGLVAGKAKSIRNVRVSGQLSTSKSIQAGVGGLCHRADEIDQCSVEADINLWLTSSTNNSTIGGITGSATNITNSIFKGIFTIYGQSRDCSIGGISASSNIIKNSIFAPQGVNMNVIFNPSFMYDNSVGPICTPKANDCVVENCYYTDNLKTSPKKGYEISIDYLCSGMTLDGYNSDIWLFKEGYLPSLRSLMATYTIQTVVNNGYLGIEVQEGDSLNYIITPDYGWHLYRFYLNDQDYTENLIQNRYRFENIDRNYVIKVIFEKKDDNAVREVSVNKINNIRVTNNTVVIDGITEGQMITLTSQDGIVEARIIADNPVMTFEVTNGVHIINIGTQSFKIIN